jgi:putative hydrolase
MNESSFTYVADLHTHTWASGRTHASGTVEEMAGIAATKGLKLIAVTDHGPATAGALEPPYIKNLSVHPIKIGNVVVLRGFEANVTDLDASLDVSSNILAGLEWVIASLHIDIIEPANIDAHTEIYLRLAENPLVDMIGHPDTPAYEFDHKRVIQEFKAKGKIIEINGPRNMEICEKIAKLCMKYDVCVAVNSDTHSSYGVGNVGPALAMLKKIGFPEELILNANVERILSHVRKRHPQLTIEQ